MLWHFQGNFITSIVMFLPYFWLLSLGIFAFVAYYNWRCTRQGYRFRRRWILLGSVGLSIFFGSVFHVFGMGNQVDRIMAKAMPFYDESKHKTRNELWLRPEIGLIMGEVQSMDSAKGEMVIKDEQGKIWNIDERAMMPIKKGAEIKKGKIVKVIGKKNGENDFVAKEIRRCGDCQDDEEDEEKEDSRDSRFVKNGEDSESEESEDGGSVKNEKDSEEENEEKDSRFESGDSDDNREENENEDESSERERD